MTSNIVQPTAAICKVSPLGTEANLTMINSRKKASYTKIASTEISSTVVQPQSQQNVKMHGRSAVANTICHAEFIFCCRGLQVKQQFLKKCTNPTWLHPRVWKYSNLLTNYNTNASVMYGTDAIMRGSIALLKG